MGKFSGKAVIPLGVFTIKAARLINNVLGCFYDSVWEGAYLYGPRLPFDIVWQIGGNGKGRSNSYAFFQANGEAALLRANAHKDLIEAVSIENCRELYKKSLHIRRTLIESILLIKPNAEMSEEMFQIDCLLKAFNGEELNGKEVLFIGHPMDAFEQAMWKPVFEKSWAACDSEPGCAVNPFKSSVTNMIKKIQGEK